MVITLEPELEAEVNEQARRLGYPPEALAIKTLRNQFLTQTSASEPPNEWERRLRQIATDCGVGLPDEALSSKGLYE